MLRKNLMETIRSTQIVWNQGIPNKKSAENFWLVRQDFMGGLPKAVSVVGCYLSW